MAVVFIGLSLLLLILPEKNNFKELTPHKLLVEINDNTRFLSTDYVADKIITGDKFLMLIDLRTPKEYHYFHLKGAINIPLKNILDKNDDGSYVWEGVLNPDVYTNVFYSNGTVYASQAWMILRRLNYENNYIMQGGLNQWYKTIIFPAKPEFDATNVEMDQYSFRQAASMYFSGAKPQTVKSSGNSSTLPVMVKKKVKNEEGGC